MRHPELAVVTINSLYVFRPSPIEEGVAERMEVMCALPNIATIEPLDKTTA